MTETRRLSGLDVLCLGVNAVVGSGIYVFPGMLAQQLGWLSFAAFGLCGLMSTVIGLCFAETSSRFGRSGGPYLYAQAAMGNAVGYVVGWSCWVAAVMSWAAVARAIPPYLGQLWPAVASGAGAPLLAMAICIALGGINLLGIKPGAITTNLLTAAKLVPLGVLLVAGLVVPRGAVDLPAADMSALPRAALAALFAFQGFEVVPVPAGETRNPRRTAPMAVLASIALATLLYMALQWLATATTPGIAGSPQPLALMGHHLLGPTGGTMVAAAAVVSMVGFCAGVALAGPRYLEPLCEDGHLPAILARRHPRLGVPHLAVISTTGATCLLILFVGFTELVNLSVLTVSLQYLVTCLAVPLLRRKPADAGSVFRAPLGPLFPLLGTSLVVWLALQAKRAELSGFALMIVVGLVLRLAATSLRRR